VALKAELANQGDRHVALHGVDELRVAILEMMWESDDAPWLAATPSAEPVASRYGAISSSRVRARRSVGSDDGSAERCDSGESRMGRRQLSLQASVWDEPSVGSS